MSYSLSASIVVFDSDRALLRGTLEALAVAIANATAAGLLTDTTVTLVDHDAAAGVVADEPYLPEFTGTPATTSIIWRRISGQGNVGFGRGHNLVLRGVKASAVDMHLVLNPDALLGADGLTQGLAWLRATPECGLVAPNGKGPDGTPLFLCKRYPDVLTLLLRAAAPAALRKGFAGRLARYELRDIIGQTGEHAARGVPLASGCCMLLRHEALVHTQGFDPNFFLYFEDYDLCLRLTQGDRWRIDYLPAMGLVHFGGYAARKSWAHVRLFATSAVRFFSKHGWKLA